MRIARLKTRIKEIDLDIQDLDLLEETIVAV